MVWAKPQTPRHLLVHCGQHHTGARWYVLHLVLVRTYIAPGTGRGRVGRGMGRGEMECHIFLGWVWFSMRVTMVVEVGTVSETMYVPKYIPRR
jgi:hypothetical protein